MSLFRHAILAIAASGVFCSATVLAQPSANGVALSTPPPQKSPVAIFRELLAMDPAERQQAISIRPPAIQERILAKLTEYEVLPPDLREQRLRETELRWYLLPLMQEPSRANREARLAHVPEEYQNLIRERLQHWDLFPPPLRQDLVNSEITADYFSQLQSAVTREQRERILAQLSPARRAELEAGLERWRHFPEEHRQKMLQSFGKFFELTDHEKEIALNRLPESERQQMEKTLEDYAKLSPAKRAQCIRSFEKFASMSVAEREMFLQNAERWKEMSPAERDTWRQLVTVAPIMPATTLLPPLPAPAPSVATN